MLDKGVEAVWVIGHYKGDRARSVLAHVNAGVGYFLIEDRGNKLNPEVIVAFRIVPEATEGIPPHLIEITDPYKLDKYEKMRKARQGLTN